MATPLAQLVVDLHTVGFVPMINQLQGLNAALGNIQAQNEQLIAGLQRTGQKGAAVAQNLTKAFADAGRGIVNALSMAESYTLRFVRAGLQGTVQGAALEWRFTMLSRSIASAFLPAVRQVGEWISRLTDFFNSLTRQQQDQISKWGLVTAGVVAFAGALRFLTVLLPAVTLATKGFTAALWLLTAHPVVFALAAIAAGVGYLTYRYVAAKKAAQDFATEQERIENYGLTKEDRRGSQVYDRLLDVNGDFAPGKRAGHQIETLKQMRESVMDDIQKAQATGKPGTWFGWQMTDTSKIAAMDEARHRRDLAIIDTAIKQVKAKGTVDIDELERGKLGKDRVAPMLGGFQSVENVFRSIQETVLKQGMFDPAAAEAKRSEQTERLIVNGQQILNVLNNPNRPNGAVGN